MSISVEARKSKLKRVGIAELNKLTYFMVNDDFIYDKEKKWTDLSQETKFLYFKMRARYNMSLLNEWVDKDGIPYIYFSIEEIMEFMSCQNQKAQKIKKELITSGLIEEVRVGQGVPNRIYLFDYHFFE